MHVRKSQKNPCCQHALMMKEKIWRVKEKKNYNKKKEIKKRRIIKKKEHQKVLKTKKREMGLEKKNLMNGKKQKGE